MSEPAAPGSPREVARDLQELLLGGAGVEDFLTQLATIAADELGPASACGVTVQAKPNSRVWTGTSNDFARRMDAIQYDVDDGPCLTCLREGVPVEVADIGSDVRWPAFSERGRVEGAGASLSVPLSVDGETTGAINLYARSAGAFGSDDHQRGQRLAHNAAGAVGLALMLADREEQRRHLEAALTSRTTIDQALGIRMGRHGITATQAFEILRRRSQHCNIKLRDIAASLIADVTGEVP